MTFKMWDPTSTYTLCDSVAVSYRYTLLRSPALARAAVTDNIAKRTSLTASASLLRPILNKALAIIALQRKITT